MNKTQTVNGNYEGASFGVITLNSDFHGSPSREWF